MIYNNFNFGETWKGENVDEVLKRWLAKVSQRSTLRMVVAIGSRTEGKAKPWSDLDLVVVVKEAPEGLDRWFSFRVPECEIIEPRVYTEEEFIEALEELDLSALEAMHHGILIYDNGFYKKAFEVFLRVTKKWKLKRERFGWISLTKLKSTTKTNS